jgi:hypothetical protein
MIFVGERARGYWGNVVKMVKHSEYGVYIQYGQHG